MDIMEQSFRCRGHLVPKNVNNVPRAFPFFYLIKAK